MSFARSGFAVLSLGLVLTAAVGCGDAEEQSTTGPGNGGGGSGGGSTTTDPGNAPTYYEDIAPIVNAHCASCHIEDGIAPFALLTYEDAKLVSGLMKSTTQAHEMPPWNPDNSGDCNTYENARWLSDDQIATIAAWTDAGSPEGDPKNAPPAPDAPTGLAKVDLEVDTGFDYLPDAGLADDYRCFVVDLGLSEDRFVTGYEVIPSDSRVVHHVILFAAETAEADAQAEANDAADPEPGYECFGGPKVVATQWTLGWAPGTGSQMYPAGTGLRVGAGRKAIVQVHYNLANGAYPDRTKIHMTLESKVDKQAQIFRVGTNDISLPPGEEDAPATGSIPVPVGAGNFTVWATLPHMHTRGRTLRVDYEQDSQTTCLVDVDNWNFHWQGVAIYNEPVNAKGGGKLKIRCGYDTTQEMVTVTNGEGTEDEMCLNFLYVTQ